jgi:hypothetical protein
MQYSFFNTSNEFSKKTFHNQKRFCHNLQNLNQKGFLNLLLILCKRMRSIQGHQNQIEHSKQIKKTTFQRICQKQQNHSLIQYPSYWSLDQNNLLTLCNRWMFNIKFQQNHSNLQINNYFRMYLQMFQTRCIQQMILSRKSLLQLMNENGFRILHRKWTHRFQNQLLQMCVFRRNGIHIPYT